MLILAIVWGILLVSWLRSRSVGSLGDSVGTFRRHLTVLERAAPATVMPANRLRSCPVAGRSVPTYHQPIRPIPGQRIDLSGRVGPTLPGLARPTAAALRRRQVQKRRRDVFFALLAGVVGSFLLAIIPGMSVMWPVQVMFDLVFAGYVALLIRIRNLAAERALKLRFMSRQPARHRPPLPTYDLSGSAYGDLSLRRAAN
ncbi:MAG: hypothetical protein ACRDWW_07105 [Acidimicrobiales bacterium]